MENTEAVSRVILAMTVWSGLVAVGVYLFAYRIGVLCERDRWRSRLPAIRSTNQQKGSGQ